MCHGVASPEVWRIYKDNLVARYKSNLEEYSFRSKYCGHHNFGTYAKFSDGTEYRRDDQSEEKISCTWHILMNFVLDRHAMHVYLKV